MEKVCLNKGWLFKRVNDSEGKLINIPHDAMIYEKRVQSSLGGINTGYFEGYDYEYKKEIAISSDTSKGYVLEFEGIYHNAEIYINGEKVYFRPYGYTDFFVDITKHVKYGQANEIKVIAHNADQPNSRWYSGSGIYRPVYLYSFDIANHIEVNGVKIKTLGINPPEIEVKVKTVGSGSLTVTILDGDKKIAIKSKKATGETAISLKLEDAKLWDVNSPKVYTCKVEFNKDVVCEKFGIRQVTWNDEGFKINGKNVLIRGACIHHDNGPLGAISDEFADRRRVKILKDVGYNALRSAHNPCSKSLLNACDELGMMVLDELVDCWYIHKTAHDYVDYFDEWHEKDIYDMVEKDYNHPSVVMYSTGNEVAETGQKKGIALTKEMTDYIHSLDDTRPVTCGINIFFNLLFSMGFGVYSDKKAEKNKTATEKKRKKVGSEFFNNLAGLLGAEAMKTGAWLFLCDYKTRGAFANMDIAGYNYGIKRYKHDLKKYPHRLILGSETFCSDAYHFMKLAEKNPRLIGDFVWAGMDYIGEVGIGSWTHKDHCHEFEHNVGWLTAGSGRVDITGKELGEALYTKVAFGLSPIEMAVVPVHYYKDKHSPSSWKMNETIDSWTFPGCEGKKTIVDVYTNGEYAELYLNGKLLQRKKRNKKYCIVQFTVNYQKGILKAIAYDRENKILGETSLKTAGDDIKLRAYPELETISKDGLAYVRFKYSDNEGIYNPLARDIIEISNIKNATLEGLANACSYNPIGYKDIKTDTYLGEAIAIFRPDGKGDISFTASSNKYGTIDVKVKVEG